MRIIAGTHRGRKLKEFDGKNIRPTTDRVKEALFNMISGFIGNAVVLDLFAGSGALSLEALSRGAARAVMVDSDGDSIKVINENISRVSYEQQTDVKNLDAMAYIKSSSEKFDIVFLDPPYNKGFIPPAAEALIKFGRLNDGAVIVTETDSGEEEYSFDGMEVYRRRRYGKTFITVYIKN